MAIEDLWYGRSAGAAAARLALAPASALYGAAVSARAGLYSAGLFATARAGRPVVSVGSLRVGGAGKTPLVLWLASNLTSRGLGCCIVTRGYGSAGQGKTFRLLEGEPWREAARARDAAFAREVDACGDEAMLLALRAPCPVAVGRDRSGACRFALRELAGRGLDADVFLLDDGFQHLALARDLDVVLMAGTEADEALLPAGPLREPPSALARASAVVVDEGEAGRGTDLLRRVAATATVLRASTRPAGLVACVADDAGQGARALEGKDVAAVAAIARPERFLGALEAAGARVVRRVLRRDHHRYDAGDRREIESAARGADLVVTTEKDLVKLTVPRLDAPLLALRVALEVRGGEALLERVAALVSRRPHPGAGV